MSFHFVDRIDHLETGKCAYGIKNVTRNESLFYWLPNGVRALSPAVVTEALAQLGSWLKMHTTDFTKRPVLLADELTSYHGFVEPGQTIDLFVEILDFDEDVVVTRSHAEVAGKPILVTKCCRGYMLPIEEFDDRARTIHQFNSIFKPGQVRSQQTLFDATGRLPALAGSNTWEGLRFVDGLLEHIPFEKVVGLKNFSLCESYFADHFPYKPVAPGVMLMTFMGEVCQYMVRESLTGAPRGRALIPTFTRNARFRKFVEPGDQCILTAKLKEGDPTKDASDIVIAVRMDANGKRVLQAEMGFRTMFGQASAAFEKDYPVDIKPYNLISALPPKGEPH